MWRYYAWLILHRRQPVFPIAVYLAPGSGGLVRESYERGLFGRHHLSFAFECVGLPDLPGEEYAQSDNPLAYALAALMRVPPGLDRVAWKLRCLQGILRYERNRARREVLAVCVNRYLPLNDDEQRRLVIMSQAQETMPLENLEDALQWLREHPYEAGLADGRDQGLGEGLERGREEGIELGRAEALAEAQRQAKQQALLYFLAWRFAPAPLPEAVQQRIEATTDEALLDQLRDRAFTIATLDELFPAEEAPATPETPGASEVPASGEAPQ
jgi:hypothetical protein